MAESDSNQPPFTEFQQRNQTFWAFQGSGLDPESVQRIAAHFLAQFEDRPTKSELDLALRDLRDELMNEIGDVKDTMSEWRYRAAVALVGFLALVIVTVGSAALSVVLSELFK